MQSLDPKTSPLARSALRAQVAALPTVSRREARAAKATSLTMPYQLRQIEQCLALLRVVQDFASCPNRLLLVRAGRGEVEVWTRPLEGPAAGE